MVMKDGIDQRLFEAMSMLFPCKKQVFACSLHVSSMLHVLLYVRIIVLLFQPLHFVRETSTTVAHTCNQESITRSMQLRCFYTER